MSLLYRSDHGTGQPGGFSNYFLSSQVPEGSNMRLIFNPVLEVGMLLFVLNLKYFIIINVNYY
jgi:hypothetical protein